MLDRHQLETAAIAVEGVAVFSVIAFVILLSVLALVFTEAFVLSGLALSINAFFAFVCSWRTSGNDIVSGHRRSRSGLCYSAPPGANIPGYYLCACRNSFYQMAEVTTTQVRS